MKKGVRVFCLVLAAGPLRRAAVWYGRILEYAANPGNGERFLSPVMQNKLQRICLGIREAFGLTNSSQSFVWEQYLTG